MELKGGIMFLCKECLEKEDKETGQNRAWLFDLCTSYGPCEDCNVVTTCVDC
jgi:hypothetical protein